MHVSNFVCVCIWRPSCDRQIPPHDRTAQVTHLQWLSAWSSDTACTSLHLSVSLWPCACLSVRVSVRLNTIYLSLQTAHPSGHLFAASDSRSCLYLTADVLFCLCVWVMSFRCSVPGAESPGVIITCFFNSPLGFPPVAGHSPVLFFSPVFYTNADTPQTHT